jgi:hypothetical protein
MFKKSGKNDSQISALRRFCATHVLFVYAAFLEKKNAFLRAVFSTEENSSAQNFRALNFRRTGRASVGA